MTHILGGRFSMTSSGELHVRDVRDSDAYIEFRCTGTSDVTAKQKISEAAKLEIHGKIKQFII
ncbi:hypothetical protein DPMN_193882 [Dreissena polymorpha]|uniref:Uncharacterized protein n=1 Tax=Dreissena polymorpha TaxID=45954 RepID=A0A9D3Y2X4_DREPO|nr:hypothetical protein DPMN_193882 [Dreissena polymorpha]